MECRPYSKAKFSLLLIYSQAGTRQRKVGMIIRNRVEVSQFVSQMTSPHIYTIAPHTMHHFLPTSYTHTSYPTQTHTFTCSNPPTSPQRAPLTHSSPHYPSTHTADNIQPHTGHPRNLSPSVMTSHHTQGAPTVSNPHALAKYLTVLSVGKSFTSCHYRVAQHAFVSTQSKTKQQINPPAWLFTAKQNKKPTKQKQLVHLQRAFTCHLSRSL